VSDLGSGDRSASDLALPDLPDAADVADAGFVCEIPRIEIPPEIDASPSLCPPELVELSGVFSGTWSGLIFGDSMFTGEFTYSSYGDLTFEIFCLGNKLWMRGQMIGLAEGIYPFAGELLGQLDAESSAAEMVVNPGALCMSAVVADAGAHEEAGSLEEAGVLEDVGAGDAATAASCPGLAVSFEVLLRGVQRQDRFDDGAWCGRSLFPPGAMGDGAWQATRE
jgi:hypothetical protein